MRNDSIYQNINVACELNRDRSTAKKISYVHNSNREKLLLSPQCQKAKQFIDRNEGEFPDKLFIVGGNKREIYRVVCFLNALRIQNNDIYSLAEKDVEYFHIDLDEDGKEEADSGVTHIDISGKIGTNVGNAYSQKLYASEAVMNREPVLITGLDDHIDTADKLDAINTIQVCQLFVAVSKEGMNNSHIDEACLFDGFEVLDISDVDMRPYYQQVISFLMEKAGIRLEKNTTPDEVLCRIKMITGENFCEEAIEHVVSQAKKKQAEKGFAEAKDFGFELSTQMKATDAISKLPGLVEVKKTIRELDAYVKEVGRNKALKLRPKHLLLAGNPGTAKTTTAKFIAEKYAESGLCNSTFITAKRSDLIGKYVGHTADKISRLFRDARNGVLLIDEAGFLLNEDSGGYVTEAIRELVRFMETENVIVIFCMYASEVENFLKLDAGLSSRISRIINFPDYTKTELMEIAEYMAKDNGYSISGDSLEKISAYIETIRNQKGFGNAREVRKIIGNIIEAHSIRLMDDFTDIFTLTMEDVSEGIERTRNGKAKESTYGFCANDHKLITLTA